MKKKLFRVIPACLLSVLLCFSLFGCAKKGLEAAGENISSYSVEAVFDDAAKTLTAKQTVSYMNESNAELSEVWFHLYPAAYRENAKIQLVETGDISDAYPNGISYGGIEIESVKTGGADAQYEIGGQDGDILIIKLPASILPTVRAQIEMEYTVKIPNMRHRLGWMNKTVNLGNWYPVACVYEDGAFQADPYYASGDPFYLAAANFSVSVTAPEKYTAAMSGQAFRRVNDDGTATTQAEVKAARDFAVVLGEFTILSENVGGTSVSYYYYNDKTPAESLAAAVDSLNTFSAKFGKYPYASLSVVQTAFLQGGMEYTGMEYISDEVTGELYRETIVHETAHQWWYGLVGNNQVRYAWMDEALAEFSTSLFYELNPSYNVSYVDRIADAMSTLVLYCDVNGVEDTTMDRAVNEFKSGLEYTYMTYVKGQLMFDALRRAIGDKALYDGLKRYCDAYSFRIARPDDLISCFEKASKTELKGFFDSWTEGKVLLFGGFNG